MEKIIINNKIHKGCEHKLVEPTGRNFNKKFKPYPDPKKMLELGVLKGKNI